MLTYLIELCDNTTQLIKSSQLADQFFSAFFIEKKTLMLSLYLSVCLSLSQFSREPRDTQNSNF